MNYKIRGGIVGTIGYILSPLSWWNDLLINIPLAYAFAFPFGLIARDLFFPMMILGYWMTNVAGFVLMHHGMKDLLSEERGSYTRKELVKDFAFSIVYTMVVVVLIANGWLKFPLEYLSL